MMPDAVPGHQLSPTSMHNLNVSLGEFVEHCRKCDGTRVTPAIMLGYLQGINR